MRRGSLLLAAAAIVATACGAPPEPATATPPKPTVAPRPAPPLRPTAIASASAFAQPEPEPPPEPVLLDPVAPLPRGAVARLGTTRMRFRSDARTAATLSSSGTPLVIEDGLHHTEVRDLFTDRAITTLPARGDAALAPDGSFLVVARWNGDDLKVSLTPVPGESARWSVDVKAPRTTVKIFRTSRLAPASVRGIVIAPDASHVAIVFATGDATLLAAKDGAITARLKPRAGHLAALSRDGTRALYVEGGADQPYGSDERVKLVEVVETRSSTVARKLEPNVPGSVRLAPDGTEILALSKGTLVAVSVASGARRVILEDAALRARATWRSGLPSFLLSPDGSRAAIADETTKVVRLSDGKVEHDLEGAPVSFSPDGKLLLMRSGNVARIEGKAYEIPDGHTGSIRELAFAAKGRLLVSRGEDVRFWNPRSGRPLARASAMKKASLIASDPAAEHLVVATRELAAVGADGKLIDLGPSEPSFGGGPLRHLEVEHAAPLPGGASVVVGLGGYLSGKSKGHVRLWSMTGSEELARSAVERPWAIAAGPDGTRVAVAGRDDSASRIFVLDAQSLETRATLPFEGGSGVQLAFVGNDARLMTSAGWRAGLQLFDVDRQTVLKRFHGGKCCTTAAASRDGRFLAAAAESSVLLWQVEPRKLQAVFRGHEEIVRALAFSPDGALLASASDDTSILIWDTSTALPAETPMYTDRIPSVSSMQQLAPGSTGFVAVTDASKGGGSGRRVVHGYVQVDGTAKVLDFKTPLTGVTRVAGATLVTCGLDTRGDVRCWGWPYEGTLGTPAPPYPTGRSKSKWTVQNTPQLVKLPAKATDLVAEGDYVCALLADATLSCWGSLFRTPDDAIAGSESLVRALPTRVSGLGPVAGAGIGDGFACALEKSGQVSCWGRGPDGQIGTPQGAGSAVPVAVPGITDARSLSVGDSHACAVLASGAVTCWGKNDDDQLGDGTGTATRIPRTTGSGFVEVAAGPRATCARQTGGDVLCWGTLGRRDALPWLEPTKAPEASGLQKIRFLGDALCGERSAGNGTEVLCVGARAVDL